MKLRNLLAAAGLAILAMPAQAEYFGTLNGRSANLDTAGNISVEGAFITGDFGAASYQNMVARINYKASPLLVIFGDFGLTEIEDFDGNSFGIGAFYMIEGMTQSVDLAAKFSFHKSSVERNNFEIDYDAISVEALFSGKDGLGANGDLGWYANIGMHRLSNDSNSETEFGFGGGLTMPLASGELFGGLDLIDEITFGIGYRHFLN